MVASLARAHWTRGPSHVGIDRDTDHSLPHEDLSKRLWKLGAREVANSAGAS